jgi:simple sugar transport system permease protein
MRKFKLKSLQALVLPALSFAMAIVAGGLLIAFSDAAALKKISHPLEFLKIAGAAVGNSYLALFQGSIYNPNLATAHNPFLAFYPLSETLVAAAPLILAGLSVALAFRAGLFNIGAQGQFIFGSVAAAYIGFHFHLPIVLHVIVSIVAGVIAASIWGGAVGFLKARTGAHEVIITIMLNYVALYLLMWILSTSQFLRPGRRDPIAPEVDQSARLPHIFGANFRVTIGIFIALASALFVWWLLSRSTWGFRFRAVGANAAAAQTAGISVPFVMTSAMAISGALAGLGGAVHVLGSDYSLTAGTAGNFGFDAITVALLGRAQPLGTVFASLLFGALRAGGGTMQANTTTPIDIILVIQALVVLFIAAPAVVRYLFRLKEIKSGGALVSKGWNG